MTRTHWALVETVARDRRRRLVRFARRARTGDSPAVFALEELAAMAGSLWTGSSMQLPSDGDLCIDQFNVCTPHWSQVTRRLRADCP